MLYSYIYLYNKGSVIRNGHQMLSSVVGVSLENGGVEHGGIAELSAVSSAEKTPGQFRVVHHWSHHILGSL